MVTRKLNENTIAVGLSCVNSKKDVMSKSRGLEIAKGRLEKAMEGKTEILDDCPFYRFVIAGDKNVRIPKYAKISLNSLKKIINGFYLSIDEGRRLK